MLSTLSQGFASARNLFSGQTTLTKEKISESLELVRTSLLEADVEYGVAKEFVARVAAKLEGQSVKLTAGSGAEKIRVSASDHFVKACQEELEALMGPVDTSLRFPSGRIATIMMVGLQGTGKTTSVGKLARYLVEKKNRKPLLVAADIYRPAAVEQLKVIGQKVGVPVFSKVGADPVALSQEAAKYAAQQGCDTIIIDTAGRLSIDEKLMNELSQIKSSIHPDNILFVCDAMMGQDAVSTAKVFHSRLSFDGFIMTKLDGDARGGAALSIKEVCGKPIKFLGMGEDLSKLEEFRPEGLASRILGLGDIVGLMEDFEKVSDDFEEERAMKMLQGQFTFDDFSHQLGMMQKMGSMKDLLAKLPIGGMLPQGLDIDESILTKTRVMIGSMTKQERLKPALLNPSRVKRIAKGSGRSVQEVNRLIQDFSKMRKLMGGLGKNMGMLGKIPGLSQLSGLNDMRKMAQSMMGSGDLASMLGMGGGMPGMPRQGAKSTKPTFDREKQKKLKKQAKAAKKKNRRK